MRRLGVILVLAAVLAACGGPEAFGTARAQIADALAKEGLRCEGLELLTVPFTRSDGTCTLAGETVTLVTFRDGDEKSEYLQSARRAPGARLAGPTWVVAAETRPTAESIRKAIGGDFVSPAEPEE